MINREGNNAGFSLLELSIVLIVMGIIAGVSLPLITLKIKRSGFLKSRENLQYVKDSLATFILFHHRFPCPADPSKKNNIFGIERKSCRGKAAEGILPFRTLGISESVARDGFKRFFTYAVEENLTTKPFAPITNIDGGALKVKDPRGYDVMEANQSTTSQPDNFIAYILISHGETGIGSYLCNRTMLKMTGKNISKQKKENMDNNLIYSEMEASEELVWWESRDQFITHYHYKEQ